MATWNAFYVRNQGDSTCSKIHQAFPSALIEAGPDFVGVTLIDGGFPPPLGKLAQLSSQLSTDVIWLSFQSVVDAFQFHHWCGGTAIRSLVFGSFHAERTWEHVEGVPEPWERDVFFDSNILRRRLACAATEEERRECERIWREAELLPGRTEPCLDARATACDVAKYYNFPGWG